MIISLRRMFVLYRQYRGRLIVSQVLLQFPLTQSLTILQVVVVMVAGGLAVVTGEITLGVVISFVGAAV